MQLQLQTILYGNSLMVNEPLPYLVLVVMIHHSSYRRALIHTRLRGM